MTTSETRTDLTLAAAVRVLEPMLKLLLREGVTYPQLSNALKKTFLEVAPCVLQDSSAKINDSSISTLTGIHRKDVREWRSVGRPLPQAKAFGAAMDAFTRWANDPAYCDSRGRPRALDRAGATGSFEALATSISKDVRPHTLLRELVRLGVAERVASESGRAVDKVSLCVDAFVPKEGTAEMLQLLSDNVGDHLAAAVHNVLGSSPPMLEQSIFADSLRPQSVAVMNELARKIWSKAFHKIVSQATTHSAKDAGQPDADQRIRVGMYFYRGPNLKS